MNVSREVYVEVLLRKLSDLREACKEKIVERALDHDTFGVEPQVARYDLITEIMENIKDGSWSLSALDSVFYPDLGGVDND